MTCNFTEISIAMVAFLKFFKLFHNNYTLQSISCLYPADYQPNLK